MTRRGVARGTVFQALRPGAVVSKPAISLKKNWGVIVERLIGLITFFLFSGGLVSSVPEIAFFFA